MNKAIVVWVLISMAMAFQKDDKIRILIIGDSISIGYTPFVQQRLQDYAEVVHNPGNAEHTGTGLQHITSWIGNDHWDIIQFNWGLWDLCYRHPDSKVQGNRDKINGILTHSIEQYANNLDSLVTLMKAASNARLVFVTTSYVPEEEAGRYHDDALRYNQAAIEVMNRHGVLIHNIYEKSKPIHAQFGKGPDDVHYTEEGYERLGQVIADFLEMELAKLDGL